MKEPKRHTQNAICSHRGLTLIETLVVVTLIGILASTAASYYYSFQFKSSLHSSSSEIVQVLRRAQSKAMAGEGGESHGVHFDSGQFVLFKGSSYDPNDSDNNVIFDISGSLEIYDIGLNGGGADVVFNELVGDTDDYGSVSIRVKNGFSKTIAISKEGMVTW